MTLLEKNIKLAERNGLLFICAITMRAFWNHFYFQLPRNFNLYVVVILVTNSIVLMTNHGDSSRLIFLITRLPSIPSHSTREKEYNQSNGRNSEPLLLSITIVTHFFSNSPQNELYLKLTAK